MMIVLGVLIASFGTAGVVYALFHIADMLKDLDE